MHKKGWFWVGGGQLVTLNCLRPQNWQADGVGKYRRSHDSNAKGSPLGSGHVFFSQLVSVALAGSFQAEQHGVLIAAGIGRVAENLPRIVDADGVSKCKA
jgi:hypothetical protein